MKESIVLIGIVSVHFDLTVGTSGNDTLEFTISATEPVFGLTVPSKYHGWKVRGAQHVYWLHHGEIESIGLNGVIINVVWMDPDRKTITREQDMFPLPFHKNFINRVTNPTKSK